MTTLKRIKLRNTSAYGRTKSFPESRPGALRVQDALILLGIIFVVLMSILGTSSSMDSTAVVVDKVAKEDLAGMAAAAERRAQDELLDMLEWQDVEPPLLCVTADAPPPPPPPPSWFNFRPLDADEYPLSVERRLEMARSMARALEYSENRQIDWEGSGVPAEIDLRDDRPPAAGLGLDFGAPTVLTATATATNNIAIFVESELDFFLVHEDDNDDGTITDTASEAGAEYGSDIDDYDPDTNGDTDFVVSDDDDDVSNAAHFLDMGHGFNFGGIINPALSTLYPFLGDTFVALPANAGPGPEFDDPTATSIPAHGIHINAYDEFELSELDSVSHLDMTAFASRYDAGSEEVVSDFDIDYHDAPLAPPPAPGRRTHLDLQEVDDTMPYPWGSHFAGF